MSSSTTGSSTQLRRGVLALGLAVLLFVWLAPLRRILPGAFSAHMTMHMGVVAVGAPLLAIGIAGSRFDPVTKAPRFFSPLPASVVELFVVWVWHAPALHLAAGRSHAMLAIEQTSFLASALFVWISALGGYPRDRVRRAGPGILALLLTSMHMTLLGALLALPPRALYPSTGAHTHHGHAAALAEQHIGGAIMLIAGAVSYLAGGLWLASDLVRRRPPPETAGARGHEGSR